MTAMGLSGGVIMCEYCHYISGHHPRCPNAPEPKVHGYCQQCGGELLEDYEYYVDNEDNKFCSDDCACLYHGIASKTWAGNEYELMGEDIDERE